jgi:hypothetical protein
MGFDARLGITMGALSSLNALVISKRADNHYVLMGECYLYCATLNHRRH